MRSIVKTGLAITAASALALGLGTTAAGASDSGSGRGSDNLRVIGLSYGTTHSTFTTNNPGKARTIASRAYRSKSMVAVNSAISVAAWRMS